MDVSAWEERLLREQFSALKVTHGYGEDRSCPLIGQTSDLKKKHARSLRTRERPDDSNATPPMTMSRVSDGIGMGRAAG